MQIKNVKVLRNALCFIMGYNGINAFLQNTYYGSNQCVYTFLDQSVHILMNLESMQKSYVLFDVT